VAQYGTILAEATLNIGMRKVTTVSSGVSVELERLEADATRYIWVASIFDAFRTNALDGVDELLDVVELEDVRTREAIRLLGDLSTGLCGMFQHKHSKQNQPRYKETYCDIYVPRDTVRTTSPLSQRWYGQQLLCGGAPHDTWNHIRLTLFSCNEHRSLKMNAVIMIGSDGLCVFEVAVRVGRAVKTNVVMISRNDHLLVPIVVVMVVVARVGRAFDTNVVVVTRDNHFFVSVVVVVVVR
jgi:hypothetical protein